MPGVTYRQLGVQLWGRGAYERESIDGAATKYSRFTVLREGDVVVNKIWARHGSVAVVPNDLDGCYVSSEFPAFEPDRRRLAPEWINWLTKTKWFWERCDAASRGTSGKNRIRPEKFLAIPIPLPEIAEQERILSVVGALMARLRDAKQFAEQADHDVVALEKAYLQKLFGNPYAAETGELGISTFHKIGDVSTDVADGPHVTPAYQEEGIPFVTALNISSGRLVLSGLKYISPDEHRLFQRRARAERGDVLITKDGTIGVPCVVDTDKEFSFFVSVALIKPNREVLDGEFLAWALRSPYLQQRIVERSRGDMIRHLVLKEIRELLVPCPPLNAQREIVQQLNEFGTQIAQLREVSKSRKVELEALSSSILAKALLGNGIARNQEIR